MIKKFKDINIVHPDGYETTKPKYVITNDKDLHVDGYHKISTIDEITEDMIPKSHFFLYFQCDDEYLYHLDKIIKNKGTFSVHPCAEKTNYVHSNKNATMAMNDTLNHISEISHYNEIIHGNICQALEQTKHIEGDYVEIGVYKGGSALTALNYMRHAKIDKISYFFDTYDGFNYEEASNSSDIHWNHSHKLWGCDETMKRINFLLSSTNPCQRFRLVKSNICSDTLPNEIKHIAVANIDVDMYDATKASMIKVSERMVKNGIMIVEDPASTPQLIGSFYAMEEFLKTSNGKKFMKIHVTGQYFLIKLDD